MGCWWVARQARWAACMTEVRHRRQHAQPQLHPAPAQAPPTWLPVSMHCSGCPVVVFQKRMQRSAVPPPEASRPCWCGDQAMALTAACEWDREGGREARVVAG